MKALVIHGAGDLRLESHEVADPQPFEVQVKIATGGVCGSDLHYYNHGGFGTISLKEPMILGHEVAGHIGALGSAIQQDPSNQLKIGDLVAVSPSRPCYQCKFCLEGKHNQCLDMRFYGSAMPIPHIQGAFRQILNADASQCVKADGLSAGEAAMAEPFAVVLHATGRAGPLLGKRVLITGCGPIGVLSIIAARRAGASEIVVVDIADNALAIATRAGADIAFNTAAQPKALDRYTVDKGYFDVLYECSGVQQALVNGINALRPQGIVLQLGLGGDMSLPMMQITAKELEIRGSFRFHTEFATAVELMQKGLVDVKPMITHTVSLDDAEQAFKQANDRSQAMKVQIAFALAS